MTSGVRVFIYDFNNLFFNTTYNAFKINRAFSLKKYSLGQYFI